VTRYVRDIEGSVFVCDGDVGAVRPKVAGYGAEGLAGGGNDVGDGEIETEVFHISWVVF